MGRRLNYSEQWIVNWIWFGLSAIITGAHILAVIYYIARPTVEAGRFLNSVQAASLVSLFLAALAILFGIPLMLFSRARRLAFSRTYLVRSIQFATVNIILFVVIFLATGGKFWSPEWVTHRNANVSREICVEANGWKCAYKVTTTPIVKK